MIWPYKIRTLGYGVIWSRHWGNRVRKLRFRALGIELTWPNLRIWGNIISTLEDMVIELGHISEALGVGVISSEFEDMG